MSAGTAVYRRVMAQLGRLVETGRDFLSSSTGGYVGTVTGKYHSPFCMYIQYVLMGVTVEQIRQNPFPRSLKRSVSVCTGYTASSLKPGCTDAVVACASLRICWAICAAV